MKKYSKSEIRERILEKTQRFSGEKFEDASKNQIYKAMCLVVKDILTEKRVEYKKKVNAEGVKRVYYMSMEFLLGRSLKNHLFNLGIYDDAREVLKGLGVDIEELLEIEPDAGLGNGGLGRLAAAYMDSLTSEDYMATGFSIKYDYGIFKQRIVDGWQTELPDDWLTDGDVWLAPRMEDTFEVTFGGRVEERWAEDGNHVTIKDCQKVLAVPYDMHVSGYDCEAVNTLRLWSARSTMDFDMALFSRGEYVKALENKAMAETISKVLYPADDHYEGKSLRLKQQYFFVSASVQSIIKKHLKVYSSLDNLAEKISIHINDTHPALCIPELMRLLLDVYRYGWDEAWSMVTKIISYTNHTVMSEALERWPVNLFSTLLPRIYQIVEEINKRFCGQLWQAFPNDRERVDKNAIIGGNEVRMANLCVAASHTVNGVSALHSEILKHDLFADYYRMTPFKFTNVTNGITHRRWLKQANPELCRLLDKLIGDGYMKDAKCLSELMNFRGDAEVLSALREIKRDNKLRLKEYIRVHNGIEVDEDSIFDVQIKRLHEYKRQLLNAMRIIDLYLKLKDNPNMKINKRTFIFGAKAAPSYYMAKQIIRLICAVADQVNNDPDIDGKIKVVFLENYRVTLAELIIPAADVSEQISVAGKEASGTSNMKFMINGAVTIGTMDGANVEIHEAVGAENIFIFGMSSEEAEATAKNGYDPTFYYNTDKDIKRVIDYMRSGIAGISFTELADTLLMGRVPDPYMVLKDFRSYVSAQNELDKAFSDRERWYRMSLINIANAGFFAADRSVAEYAERIWNLDRVK